MEDVLKSDLEKLIKLFRKWRLQPNTTRTETTWFHLCNKLANSEVDVYLEDAYLSHNKHLKYLSVVLDYKLTYR